VAAETKGLEIERWVAVDAEDPQAPLARWKPGACSRRTDGEQQNLDFTTEGRQPDGR
jgi:hypothetical protein